LLAAHLLEVSPDDIELNDGVFSVKGSPSMAKTIQDIALQANVAWNLPPGMEPGLEASAFYDPPNFTYPFGTHISVVEVNAETGTIASTPCVYNAVLDALRPLGVKQLDMPLTPERIWRAIQDARSEVGAR